MRVSHSRNLPLHLLIFSAVDETPIKIDLHRPYDEAIAKLKREAYEIGANCIVGLGVNMDEISGKGKEMFYDQSH